MALFMSGLSSACFCRISQQYQVYSSTTEYRRASLTILSTKKYNLPFMGHKNPYLSSLSSACFCRISQQSQVYSSTTEYRRASLTILSTKKYNLPFMGHKNPYLSSLLVTCHQSSRSNGVLVLCVLLTWLL